MDPMKNQMKKLKDRIKFVLSSKHPVKILLAYVLRKTKLSYHFTIDKCHYKMRFYPSALLMHYWVDKNAREEETTYLEHLVKIGSVVIDVGANVGTLSLPLAVRVGKYGKVYSIEASPITFQYLKGNIELNKHIKNIYPLNYAIGEKKGFVDFSNISSDDMNRVVQEGKQTQRVPMTTLDFIIKENNINKIRLLKIDIEGYELFALQGAQNTLEITDIVFFESWEKHYQNYGYSTKDVIKLLNTKGFEVYKFDLDYNLIKIDENYSSKVCENLIAFKNPKDIDAIYEKN